jgi:hypothetical protein
VAGLQILKNFSIFNTFQLDEETRFTFKEAVYDLLTDEQLEVRLTACLTLTGLIHSKFIEVDLGFLVKKQFIYLFVF